MASVTIYGASDDLIEVQGAITDEFMLGYEDDNRARLAFSDGTVLSVQFDQDGVWRLCRVVEGSAQCVWRAAGDNDLPNPDEDYSDRITLCGDIRWCAQVMRVAEAKG